MLTFPFIMPPLDYLFINLLISSSTCVRKPLSLFTKKKLNCRQFNPPFRTVFSTFATAVQLFDVWPIREKEKEIGIFELCYICVILKIGSLLFVATRVTLAVWVFGGCLVLSQQNYLLLGIVSGAVGLTYEDYFLHLVACGLLNGKGRRVFFLVCPSQFITWGGFHAWSAKMEVYMARFLFL
ncbi:hypothetical protein Nepgr_018918 [Nepenthes gracilis]|uniref:Uncharacterized protein n=1 Tax=Nepenthes gracilis TaxID=150966 RepID=A0AAD3SU28_NEPGR|nr:hypothetical protein Nepgr_018918 [Nepenthes gracilis]